AVKSLPPEMYHSEYDMEDVKDNYALVSKLVHQNSATYKTLEKDDDGDYFVVMEYVQGEMLRRWMKRKRREGGLRCDEVFPVLRQVAEALDFAHKKKVIHRDVKPANVMVESDGTVKVLDFGLAAQIRSSYSHLSMAETGKSGTRQYMSPEQWRGQPQGAAADQYALAAMAYEMLGGYVPFDNDDTSVLREIVLKEQSPRLEDYSDTVNAVLARGLAKEAKQRFANCVEFVAALEKAGKAVHEEKQETTQQPLAQKAPVEPKVTAPPPSQQKTITPSVSLSSKRWDNLTITLADDVKLELIWIPAGTFMMGSPEDESGRSKDETQHQVTLTKGFWIGKYPVTQAQYKAVVGTNPSYFKEKKQVTVKGNFFDRLLGNETKQVSQEVETSLVLPVETVSWDEANRYCSLLNKTHVSKVPSGFQFSLPTEAQWEYACRAGTTTPFNFGNSLSGDKANCDGRYPYNAGKGRYMDETVPVGSYAPNAWGLCDMHGNVWEWCHDWCGKYPNGAVVDPTGPSSGSRRVLRGGGWYDFAVHCRSAYRFSSAPSLRNFSLGFRLALVPVQ
ncbi:MAG: SUMF1/EgtB/PvdO family nonheme iron enzyme, partial [Lentisphaeria bacterium]|nr:SUMF1/EgtB/PvdO family nonheme iron enzyme [Lentisphaeria bacterium]